jgi:hypothetical protein
MPEGQYGNETSVGLRLHEAAAEFRRRVEDAASSMNATAEQFVKISADLLSAVEEARQAAELAREARMAAARAEEARRSVEQMKAQLAQEYGNVTELVHDLQQRLGALAILALPLPSVESLEAHQPPPQPRGPASQSESQPLPARHTNPGESTW